MRNTLFNKGLALVVIILFIGMSIVPSTGINTNKHVLLESKVSSVEFTSQTTIYFNDDNTEGSSEGTIEKPFQYIQDVVDFASEDNTYGVQWLKNYGSDFEGGRFEGPQPIGDCDNDGKNELLIGGRDATLAVMKWDDEKQTYIESAKLHSPFYPLFLIRQFLTGRPPPDPGGFAIGDVTGDGENEIVATWYGAVYKYIAGRYRIIGFNSWIFKNGRASSDC